MVIYNKLFPILAVLAGGLSTTDEATCTFALELLILQDGSTSFEPHIDRMQGFMHELYSTLHEQYQNLKIGISSFSDKPVPFSGLGPFGNWPEYTFDYCYRAHTPLTTDIDAVVEGLKYLRGHMGSGNDFPENPMEALMYAAADTSVGWSPPEVTYSEDGRPIVRAILLITDDIAHGPGDAYNNVERGWNCPRTYTDSSNPMVSQGGFGSHNFPRFNQLSEGGAGGYDLLPDIYAKIDHDMLITEAEEATLTAMLAKFGPSPMTVPVPHPGDTSMDCALTDYPSDLQVGAVLRQYNVLPMFVVTDPGLGVTRPQQQACQRIGMSGGKDCLAALYAINATAMGFQPLSTPMDESNTMEKIIQTVNKATDLLCLSTTAAPLQTSSATETTEEEEESTSAPRTSPIIPAVSTEESESTSPGRSTKSLSTTSESSSSLSTTEKSSKTTTTSSEAENSEKSSSSSSGTTEEEEATTSDGPFVPPVVPPGSGGSKSIATIAGASAGGAAAVAAAAGLFTKFGGGLFGGSPPAPLEGIQQVEVPENPVERETMEEVTMDMFQ